MNETLNYWTPAGGSPAPVLPPQAPVHDRREQPDWLTISFVVCVAVAGAFTVVIAMAWAMGG